MKALKICLSVIVMLFTTLFSVQASSNKMVDFIEKKCPPHVRGCGDSQKIASAIKNASRQHNVSSTLILAVMAVESTYKPHARTRTSRGLMQVNVKVHHRKFKRGNVYNIPKNVAVGVGILKACLKKNHWDRNKSLTCYMGGSSKTYRRRIANLMASYARMKG